jgi:hypothetical protein
MGSNNRNRRIAVGTAFAAAILASTTVARADDVQISIDGSDLFPTAGNGATATSDTGDIAIAIGNGADASATGGTGDFAYVDGAGSTAEAGFNGDFDSAVVVGANSTAEAGFGSCGSDIGCTILDGQFMLPPPQFDFDTAAAFGNGLTADATSSSFVTAIEPSSAAAVLPAAAPTSDGAGPFEDLLGDAGINSWTPSADALLLADDPGLAATLDTSVESFYAGGFTDDPLSLLTFEFDPSGFGGIDPYDGGLPDNLIADLAVGTDYALYASDLTSLGTDATYLVQIPYDILIALAELPLLPFILAAA